MARVPSGRRWSSSQKRVSTIVFGMGADGVKARIGCSAVAALGAGWGVRQAASGERILIAPAAPLTDTPT